MIHLCSSGSNAQGQLGNGSLDDAHTFRRVSFETQAPDITRIIDVAGGANHTILLLEARRADETRREIWGCGDGRKGQLGAKYQQDGPKSSFTRLVLGLEAAGLEEYTFKFIAATWETTYIVLEHEGKGDVVISLGSDEYGDLGVGDLRSAKGKENEVAQDFYIVRFDHLSTSHDAPFGPNNLKVKAISSGQRHVVVQLCLTQTNSPASLVFVGWGASRHGQLGPSSTLKPAPIQPLPQLVHSPDPDSIESYAAGIHHSVFLSSVGRLSALGSDRKDQLQVVEHFSSGPGHVQFVGCTWHGTYAVVQDDDCGVSSVYSSGSNSHSQLGWIPPSGSDERVGKVAFHNDSAAQKAIVQMACGSEHVLILFQGRDSSSARQELWGWGWNEHGNLGTGDTNDLPTPIRIWSPTPDDGLMKIEGVWAGCGTSWIAYRNTL